ncbi:transglutaminase-like cysteine peptidase [Pseudochrobactrum sp. HB0163]|uniref:transglutaminase-like cysteine peptidase n=1 Tax=Pseudochrobactrum sp. HB0163 TaxID=3450708 RepID=UPI003F6DDDC6
MYNKTAHKKSANGTTAHKKLAIALLLLTTTFFSTAPASFAEQAADPWMKTTGRTTQPVGHYDFCKIYKNECNQISLTQNPLRLTQPVWAKIQQVNMAVNTTIEPRTDMEIWGKEEVWSYPTQYGDCEDYVLLKRRMLIEAGLPVNTLLITVVRQQNGEGHAVLTIRTDRGDFILDNLEDSVKPWHQTSYTFLKRQSARHSGQWVDIRHDPHMLMSNIPTSALGK